MPFSICRGMQQLPRAGRAGCVCSGSWHGMLVGQWGLVTLGLGLGGSGFAPQVLSCPWAVRRQSRAVLVMTRVEVNHSTPLQVG